MNAIVFKGMHMNAELPPSSSQGKPEGIYATLLAKSVTEEADALIAKLSAQVYERRKNKGRERETQRAVGAFIADLLRANDSKKAQGLVYRPMKAEAFTGEDVSYRAFRFVVESFEALGWIEQWPGKRYWTANHFDPSAPPYASGGYASRFKMTPELLAVCGDVTSAHFIEPLPEHPIILRSSSTGHGEQKVRGKNISFKHSERSQLLEDQMKELNLFLSKFEMRPYRFTGLVRIFSEGDRDDFNWDKGGRLYGRGDLQYQYQSKEDRKAITIDGEAVAELDIRASFLATYHGLMKASFDPSIDPYELPGIERDAVKLWMVATFGSNGHRTRWPKKHAEEYLEEYGEKPPKVSIIKEAMISKFPVLAHWGTSGHTWADLHYHEASAVFATMFMLMKVHQVPSFPVHDSLIVRARDAEVAKEFLTRSYKMSLRVDVEVR